MSALITVENSIFECENRFNAVNEFKLNFKKEANFALQLLGTSDFLLKTAIENPASLENAISNLAAIGLSLNPALKEAYLVPRSKAICLDPSAIGLIKLATDSGSILWGQAKPVYEKDSYKNNGVGNQPTHTFDAFGDRGPVIGVYVVVKTIDGDFLSGEMSVKDCHAIRDRSELWKKSKSGPWLTDEIEMMKKTVIKREQKYWPKSERVAKAVDILNQHDGIDFSKEKVPHVDSVTTTALPDEKIFKNIIDLLTAKNRTEQDLLDYMNTQFGLKEERKLNAVSEFNSTHIDYAYRAIGSMK